jgi:hypothetical protein
MTTTSLTRLADARPEVSRRPHTVVSPADRAGLLRSITGAAPTDAPYVDADADSEAIEIGLRPASRPARRPALLAAAVLLVVAAIGLGLVLRDDGGSTPVAPATPAPSTTPAPTTSDPRPPTFDPDTAGVLFTGDGDLNAVLGAYVADRFDPAALPTVAVTEDLGDRATATWTFGTELEGTIASGTVRFRRDPEGWAVVASTIDGVDLASITNDGHRVTGTVTTTNVNSLALDVLDAGGLPVPGSPEVGTTAVDGDVFGTAGMGDRRAPLTVDVPVAGEPVVVRARLVGGTILGVAEVVLEPPPTVVEGGTTGQDGWWLRTERKVDGWCVGLASGAGRVCTTSADELWPADVWYLTLGPTVERPGQVIITGLVNPAVASLHVLLADGSFSDAPVTLLPDGSSAYAVVTPPKVDGPATVQLLDAGGQVLDTVELAGLLPVGG